MSSIKKGQSANFATDMFVKNFNDMDGDSYCEILILSLTDPLKGRLHYKGIAVKIGDCVPAHDAGKLTYLRETDGVIADSFNFKISDNNQNKQYSNMAKVTINIGAFVNRAPSQVGNLTVTMAHAATKIFSGVDFTTGLSPVFADPEGDQPSKLKVLSLPLSGLLKLSGINVTIGQEILFSSIQSGLFTYVADSSNIAIINTEFNFSMSDTGSGLFTS